MTGPAGTAAQHLEDLHQQWLQLRRMYYAAREKAEEAAGSEGLWAVQLWSNQMIAIRKALIDIQAEAAPLLAMTAGDGSDELLELAAGHSDIGGDQCQRHGPGCKVVARFMDGSEVHVDQERAEAQGRKQRAEALRAMAPRRDYTGRHSWHPTVASHGIHGGRRGLQHQLEDAAAHRAAGPGAGEGGAAPGNATSQGGDVGSRGDDQPGTPQKRAQRRQKLTRKQGLPGQAQPACCGVLAAAKVITGR